MSTKRESSAERYKRILAENAEALRQKRLSKQTYDTNRVRVNIDETDPLFSASPASQLEVRDLRFLRSIPQVLRSIELTPGPKGDKGKAGLNGKDGRDGIDGKDGAKGPKGDKGDPASLGELQGVANSAVKRHEDQFDHSKIGLIGTKKVNEKDIADGKFLQYDQATDSVVYATIKQVAQQIVKHTGGGGTTLPGQTGNSGKYLTTDGSALSWATVSGSGDVVGPASAIDNNFASFDLTTGKLIQDSGFSSASFAAALGADDNYVTDAEKTKLSNLSGTNTGDQNLFRTIAVSGQSDVVADSTTDTLTLVAGSNISITTNATNDSITITGTGGGSGITRSVNVISTPTTAGATAATDYVYLVSGTTTLTMPTAVSNTNRYTVKNVGVATVTIAFDGVETGDGSSTISLPVANTSVDLISDNSNWYVV